MPSKPKPVKVTRVIRDTKGIKPGDYVTVITGTCYRVGICSHNAEVEELDENFNPMGIGCYIQYDELTLLPNQEYLKLLYGDNVWRGDWNEGIYENYN